MQRVIERILNLLAFLLTAGRPVTASEIRMTVAGYDQDSDDAFHRMFERDKDLIRQLGIPIELVPTDAWEVEHGYVVSPEYALPDPGLTDEERASLWLAAQMVRIGGEAAGPGALFKLGGTSLTASGEPLAAELGASPDALGTMFGAVTEKRALEFDYRGSTRTIQPYGLVHRRGHWYVVGPDAPSGEVVKAYRVDRADRPRPVGERDAFARPGDFDLATAIPGAPWEAGSDEIQARIVFDPEVAWWARRQISGGAAVADREDGALEVSMTVANVDAFIGWLLAFEDHAEIIEPTGLRRKLLERVEARS